MENQTLNQVSEITLTYRPQIRPQERPKVITSKEAYDILLSSWDKGKIEFIEEFKVMLLNARKKVLGIYTVSTGGLKECLVDAKLVFASALLGCATDIVLAHNHPSGNKSPSVQDLNLTKKLSEIGKLLDINVVDHIIVTLDSYYSFADESIL
jgi:DNA repair protein RadC